MEEVKIQRLVCQRGCAGSSGVGALFFPRRILRLYRRQLQWNPRRTPLGAQWRGRALELMAQWTRISLRGVRALNERVQEAFLIRPSIHLLSQGQGLLWASRRALPHRTPRDFMGGGGLMQEDAAGRLPCGPSKETGELSDPGGAGRKQ